VRGRLVLGAWVAVAVVLLLGLVYELKEWRSIDGRRAARQAEQVNLETQIKTADDDIRREQRAHSDLIRDLQWSSNRGDPSVFLNGLAEFAQGQRLKIMGVGPLERQAVTQFSKSWHTVQVTAPYRELKEFATRVEKEGGILEEVSIQIVPSSAAQAHIGPDEVQASMRLTALELTPRTKEILQKAVAATGQPAAPPQPALALPLPPAPTQPTLALRDPFAFAALPPPPKPVIVASAPRARAGAAPAGPAGAPPAPERAPVPMTVKGIVKFPGGHLAIVNDQIVQVGDTVSGHRVEQISDTVVTVREGSSAPRSLALPSITAPQTAGPRR
jgi:hypothetical protein